MLVSRTGLSISPKRLVRITGLAATAMWLIFTIFTGAYWGGSPVVALMSLGGFVALASIGLLQWLRATVDTRRKRLERQLPGAMDVIARGLRAGYPVVAAIALAASELEAPLGPELALIVDATTYGADFKDSLKTFAVRSNSDAVGFFATAVGIQSETGGNLGELLEELSVIMKSRSTLRMKVSALASEGKATAWMLSALPFALVAFQMAMNPRFYLDKVGDPIFWPAVIVMGMLFTVGWILMNKIINFKY
jgi:tight adherence protein B